MKYLLVLTLAAAAAAPAWAAKPCETLKAELTTKIESHGAKNFTLEVVAPDQTGDKRVVGSCDGGSKKIVYSRKASEKSSGKSLEKSSGKAPGKASGKSSGTAAEKAGDKKPV